MKQNAELIKYFPLGVRGFWQNVLKEHEKVEEIRIRADKPMMLKGNGKEWYADKQGQWVKEIKEAYSPGFGEIQELVDYWCKDSRYAYQKELKNGFLTISGGHRIGICGETVLDAEGKIQTIKNISSLNIRFARQCRQAGERILPCLYEKNILQNTLILSPPGAGKTTLLRDLVRRVSDGNEFSEGKVVGLVDERGELAASYQGIPQLDIGLRTDVMDGCSKEEGMIRLLRSMGPQVIAVDELGSMKEIKALFKLSGCGCSILATMHGRSLEEMGRKRMLKSLWKEKIFTRVLLLGREEGRFYSRIYKEADLPDWSTSH
ncbi:MAG: stage III sporulation protein AA [Lachnospiraceae bacterium]|nr:stage III sporulation protein AA [Lachnospiraceae bacterium]